MGIQNLSHLVTGLMGDSSMHAGNTVSVNPPFSPVGSESEATQGIEAHSRPELDIPPVDHDVHDKTAKSGSRPKSAFEWKKI